ncbi:MAG: hypothetical protein JW974_00270 [Alphaproteobacteria bacterium]|nr:hypothetical protein [Alphaproteobacteria bacterium]MBN2675050.1 hypothetical protein [Alphaproteobacteria bacterium]
MKKISKLMVNCSLLFLTPFAANAAGTYYNGTYQPTQQRYNTTGYYPSANQQQNSYNNYYSQYQQPQYQQVQQQPSTQQRNFSETQQGFYLDGGISRETAMWQFEMKDAGSILSYNNISWNVFDVNGGYKFDMGNTPTQIDVGIKIGSQAAESTMVDDDITNGGYFITQWVDSGTGDIIGDQIGHALSIGTTSGGSMFGFNIGFGLTDFFKWGNAKITPSIGYRNFGYKLETKQNYGLSVDTSSCFIIPDTGEIQCDSAIVIHYADGTDQVLWRDDMTDPLEIVGTDPESVDIGGTYYYQQPGVSHSYEVTWSGPYAALDIRYDINQYNSVDGRIELGLPSYTATGNQPYRSDWQHPKSIEDSAGIGSAMHFGLAGNWNTALTDTVMLSVGLTYDYYSISGANAKTYLSEDYYMGIYDALLTAWETGGFTEADMLDPTTGDPTALNIKALESSCPGWVCSADGEIESFYKSMGIRVGLSAKF